MVTDQKHPSDSTSNEQEVIVTCLLILYCKYNIETKIQLKEIK